MSNYEVEPWVTVREVAAHVGVTVDTLYRWVQHSGLPAGRAGRHWRFKLSEVDAWLAQGAVREGQLEKPREQAQ